MSERPNKTVQQVLTMMRENQTDTNTQVAWQDFLELTPDEQTEFLFRAMIEATKSAEWAVGRIKERR